MPPEPADMRADDGALDRADRNSYSAGSHARSRWMTLCHFRCYAGSVRQAVPAGSLFAGAPCRSEVGSVIFDPLTGRLPWLCWFDECPGRTPGYMVGAGR